jgi:ABC-type spermidine/putrescine transport system permease subunit II
MLFYYSFYICKGSLWLSLIILGCTAYAYVVNKRRPDSDPKKRNYSPYAIFIAPITLPFVIAALVCVFLVRALLFALFIIVFTIATVAIRKPFLFVLLDKIARGIGEPLLKINTSLIRLAAAPWNTYPATR